MAGRSRRKGSITGTVFRKANRLGRGCCKISTGQDSV
jgi:hypothetical protein